MGGLHLAGEGLRRRLSLIETCPNGLELPSPRNGSAASLDQQARKPRPPGVLIADDEARLRALLLVTLKQYGFSVWLAADGPEAVQVYRERRPEIDLVVLDLGMPGQRGHETLGELRNLNPDVRCCFMANTADFAYERELLERGAKRIFQKPFEMVVFGYMLWQLVDHSGSPAIIPCRLVANDDSF